MIGHEELAARLQARANLAHIQLAPAISAQLESYLRLLAKWNRSINLTALPVDAPTDESIDRLLIEPLAAADVVGAGSPVWFDLGSGGGSPAIPLKLAKPGARLVMVESRQRKVAFLNEAIRALGIEHAEAICERIENVAGSHPLSGSADIVTVRAVKIDEVALGASRSLLKLGGQLILFGAANASGEMGGFEPSVLTETASEPQAHKNSFLVLKRKAD
jgi:16S rRNA (guanine527-N7)-methyltransferase